MFRKTCAKCKSPNVNVLKSFNGWKTLHQFCRDCGTDQTAIGLKKARITRYKPRRASKTRKSTQSTTYAIGLVLWAIFSVVAYGATAYAEMSEPIVYTAEVASTTERGVAKSTPPLEKTETIVQKIDRVADENNIPRWKLHALVDCESTYNPKARNTTKSEDSAGLVQINMKVHRVTLTQAQDPDFALSFAVKHWTKRHSMWYNCSIKHSL